MSYDNGGFGRAFAPGTRESTVRDIKTEAKLPVVQAGILAACMLLAFVLLGVVFPVAIGADVGHLLIAALVAGGAGLFCRRLVIYGQTATAVAVGVIALGAEVAWFVSGLQWLRLTWWPVWYPDGFIDVYLWGRGLEIPAGSWRDWARGLVALLSLALTAPVALLGFRMGVEVFAPNWMPTYTQAKAEWGPNWLRWPRVERPAPAPVMRVEVTRRGNGNGNGNGGARGTMAMEDIPGTPAQLRQMAQMLLAGASFAERNLAGKGRPLSGRSHFEAVRDVFLRQGWVEWTNPDEPRQGLTLTAEGGAFLEQLARMYPAPEAQQEWTAEEGEDADAA